MNFEKNIFYTILDLMPGVPLNIYALKGSEYSILIDTGIKGMRDQVLSLCDEAGKIDTVLITHAHADHIGCNVAVKQKTKAKFFAAGAIPWIENMETHYMEFCIPSEHLPDSKEQRDEILGLMDGAVNVDVVLKEGMVFRPGNDIELEVIMLPGHKLEEAGFMNRVTGDLFTGDILLALAAPFFHGFQTERGFRKTLGRLRKMLNSGEVKRVFAAHHHPLSKEKALEAINITDNFLDQVRENVIKEAHGVDFPTLWQNVCANMNKQLEFRGFAMLEVQVSELVKENILYIDSGRIFRK